MNFLSDLSGRTAERIAAQVGAAKRSGDVVVLSIHWGGNWGYAVPPAQRSFAHALIDAGVDVVHGHSSHHPKGIEVYRDRLILYGCGDFLRTSTTSISPSSSSASTRPISTAPRGIASTRGLRPRNFPSALASCRAASVREAKTIDIQVESCVSGGRRVCARSSPREVPSRRSFAPRPGPSARGRDVRLTAIKDRRETPAGMAGMTGFAFSRPALLGLCLAIAASGAAIAADLAPDELVRKVTAEARY